MSATSQQRQPDAGSSAVSDAGATPPTPTRHGRARHARTNASLTSSIGSTSTDAPLFASGLPRRTSVPNEASRIFQATGFDPFGTEPDTLFLSLTVKEVEAYERAVRSTALGKQEELRSLVGQRYEDLLGTANTIIDMAGSSSGLSHRLLELLSRVRLAAATGDKVELCKRANRRKSFLPIQDLTASTETSDASSLHQEALYVLGASLRLIMDASEYVWKSIEKGKTLQASWAYMLTRATWTELTESVSHRNSQSALALDEEKGIDSVSEAVSLLKVNVKKMFPFIEKQWLTMLPMRKQIIHRAVSLLSDAQIESMAVADQLTALVLLDGTKLDQAYHLLLSQRLTALRRMLSQQPSKSISHHRAASRTSIARPEGEAAASTSYANLYQEDRAARTSRTIAELVTLFARTLQHAAQMFVLPSKTDSASSSKPLVLDLLSTITDPVNLDSTTAAAGSPTSERTFSPTSRQNAATLRAQRRRSSYGLPVAQHINDADSEAIPDKRSQAVGNRPMRVSTVRVIQALPSGRILSRLLPPSLLRFAPHLNLEGQEQHSFTQAWTELSSWSAKARETIVGNSQNTSSATLRLLLSELSEVSELSLVRSSFRIALHRARRIVARKLAALPGSTNEHRQEAVSKIHAELERLEDAIDAILQERLLQLMSQKLGHAVKDLLLETEKIVSSLSGAPKLQADPLSRVDAPLDALFHPVESQTASGPGQLHASTAGPKHSRAFALALQDHVSGRSKQVDRLASLYEKPLATLLQELQLYEKELGTDKRSAMESESIRTKFESILSASRAEVETGLVRLLEQAQASSKVDAELADHETGASKSTWLIMRIIAVLPSSTSSEDQIREPVNAALERFWRPRLELRIATLPMVNTATVGMASDATNPSVSDSMLCALAMLSESIVQLGPALAGPELARQVRNVLEDIANRDSTSASDSKLVRALLTCDAASLSHQIAGVPSLHRIRLALAPLVLALGITASGLQTTGLAPAEPASAIETVKPILTVSQNKVDRFSPLPVR